MHGRIFFDLPFRFDRFLLNQQGAHLKRTIAFSAGAALFILLALSIIIPRVSFINQAEYITAKKGKGPDARPAEWAMLQRTFPHGQADWANQRQVFRDVRRERALAKSADQPQWQFAGPLNIGGRITDIEFDPLNPQIVYAGAATGGVFKSYDGGETWSPIFDDQAVLTIGDLAVDPINPQIIYVGTGEANGGHNNFPGAGLFKSSDGGYTWELKGLEETASIGRILVHPSNPQRVWVAAVGSYFAPNPQRGVYVSEDGGDTWQQSLFVSDSTGAIDLVMDPQNPDFMLAAMWERVRRPVYTYDTHLYGKTSAIYRTTDGGENWQLLGSDRGLPNAGLENVGRIGLTLYPGDSRIIYALYTDGFNISGLYRTDNGGDLWYKVDPNNELQEGDAGFSWYFGQVRVHPDNPDIVFVLDVSLMRSTDGGYTWPIKYGYSGPSQLHVDHHALAFHPQNPDYIVEGNDGGINISKDGGTTWSKVKHLPVTQFYEIGLDATYPFRLYGGTQDNGTLCTRSGAVDDWIQINGADGFYVLVDPTNPDIIYASSQFGNLVKITNNGTTRQQVMNGINSGDKRNWSTPVVMDPYNSNILYYGTNRLYRTDNGAQVWYPISGNLSRQLPDQKTGTITTIAVAPSDAQVIYVGTDDGLVWVSRNYGQDWENVSATLPFRWVTRVVVHPDSAPVAYVTYSGLRWKDPQPHVFRTADYGQTWQDISSNLPDIPVNAFAVDPQNTEVLYLGSDVGAFYSMDRGGTWSLLGDGLPLVVINDMKIHDSTYTLVVGTHGRSMYTMDLTQVTGIRVVADPGKRIAAYTLHQNYPNPFNPVTAISYQLGAHDYAPVHVELNIYTILGQKVATLVSEEQPGGVYRVIWDTSRNDSGRELAAGVYLYRLSTDQGFVQTRKMILLR